LCPKAHPTRFSFGHAVQLPLGTDVRLALPDGAQHVAQQATGGIAGVDVVIEDMQIDMFAFEHAGHLAQVPSRPGEAVQTGDHERIAFPEIVQAGAEPRPCRRPPAKPTGGMLRSPGSVQPSCCTLMCS